MNCKGNVSYIKQRGTVIMKLPKLFDPQRVPVKPKPHPEMTDLAKDIADLVSSEINRRAPKIGSSMSMYREQFVLEELIRILKDRV